jgi:hypothetical protein
MLPGFRRLNFRSMAVCRAAPVGVHKNPGRKSYALQTWHSGHLTRYWSLVTRDSLSQLSAFVPVEEQFSG